MAAADLIYRICMELYDTHSHLDYPEFQHDIDDVIRRAVESGVTRIISVGTDLDSSKRAIALSERFENVYAAIGWHPSFAERAPEDISDELLKLSAHPKVVAIGETGLDFYRLPSKDNPALSLQDEVIKEKQHRLFIQQLNVAEKSGLNVIIHQRESFAEVVSVLSKYRGIRAVFHCFTGTSDELVQILKNGWLVSFTGIVTFKNAGELRLVVSKTPVDKMMLETDCPFLAPVPYRGKRCEPAFVRFTAETIAKIKNCSIEEVFTATSAAANNFFNFCKSRTPPSG